MRTEEEARTKWCPFARSAGVTDGGEIVVSNRDAESINKIGHAETLNPLSCRCIASGCQAWRWDHKQIVGEFQPEHGGKPENRHGYCGLAGRPE